MKIVKIKFGKYEIRNNGNKAIIEFCRNGRYDSFDGKYHPAWLVYFNNNTFVCNNKEHAFELANKKLLQLSSENIAENIFGEMRHLTPEENEKKRNMYLNMSEPVDGISFFD